MIGKLKRRSTPGAVDPGAAERPTDGVARTFVDPGAQAEFAERGFVVIPFLSADDLDFARALAETVVSNEGPVFSSTTLLADRGSTLHVHHALKERFQPTIDRILVNHTILNGFFANKRRVDPDSVDGDIELHQDLTYVDERRWRGAILFCPLVDITVDMGPIRVLPGSHRFVDTPRGTGDMPWAFRDVEAALEPLMETVTVRLGEALVYDGALVHCSPPNHGPVDRPVLGLGMAPCSARLIRYHGESGQVVAYEVAPEYFRTETLLEKPGSGTVRREPVATGSTVTMAQFEAMAERVRSTQGKDDRLARVAPRVAPIGRSDLSPRSAPEDGPRATFSDPHLQASFDRQGYVVVPFLDESQVAAAVEAYWRLGPASSDLRMTCHFDFQSDSVPYKSDVERFLRPIVEPRLHELLDDYHVINPSYVMKWPGPRSGFAPHQDITLLDETLFRSVTAWCALTDVLFDPSGDNGVVHFVPGSHDFVPSLRAHDPGPFAFTGLESAIVETYGVPVPLRAGEAVIFNHRVVHFSMPNRSGSPRLAMAVAARPREAAMFHFRRHDGWFDVYSIDDEFFVKMNPFLLREGVPGYSQVDRVNFERPDVTSEQFDAWCREINPTVGRLPKVATSGRINSDPFCYRCGRTNDLVNADYSTEHGNLQALCRDCTARVAGLPDPATALGTTRRPLGAR